MSTVSVAENEKVLEIDAGDSHTMCMYLALQSYTLKMVNMVNFPFFNDSNRMG